ncbi:GerAB/ArcD/ProY family transporter [Heyndrickxia acidicola]|uniref:GerAB/ArcD/ProY family transporter n=1 Tax=Heyndrickxia acidicola TaxID=209389 RepID=A0ABU6MFZ9_9BACI|nr:GerAB/ArcD/ProY family transporter [Heyndrickxia acidicola]MED1203302.1 GerAB/ArcD/ProY family transporter [Heyndrickxia acidicola]
MKPIPDSRKISPFLVFFLMGNQVGIGAMGFQRIIARIAGYDGWISVILAGLSTNLVVWFMYRLMEKSSGDLNDTHFSLMGKWIGGFFSFIWFAYFMSISITLLRSYIEVVEVWMFPDFSTFWFGTAFLLLCIYIIFGGFRTIAGVSFFAFVLPFYIIFIFGLALQFHDFRHFLPLFDHSGKEILLASQDMSLTYLGYESVLFFYPFIKNPERSKKWIHLGIGFTTLLYTYVTFVSFAFFTQEQLIKEIWPTLSVFKIIDLPVVERFEYIGIANWCLIILPNVCTYIWCASRILKRTVKLNQRIGVVLICMVCLFCLPFLKTRLQIDSLLQTLSEFGFLLNYIYVPLLCITVILVKKVKNSKQASLPK